MREQFAFFPNPVCLMNNTSTGIYNIIEERSGDDSDDKEAGDYSTCR